MEIAMISFKFDYRSSPVSEYNEYVEREKISQI